MDCCTPSSRATTTTAGGRKAGLIMDAAGNLYGAAMGGGSGYSGTVFELSPSGNNWTYPYDLQSFRVLGTCPDQGAAL